MLTVRDLIAEAGVRVLAGEAALDAPVRWVHISELLDPTPWLSGGEVLLSTGMALDTPERQRELVVRLADHQLSGLGFGTGFAHERVPEPLLSAAAEREFPVFEVPYEVPFIALTEVVFTQLAGEQYALLRRALRAHERLERPVLSQRGLEALAAALSSLLGAAVIVLDARGQLLASRSVRRAIGEEELARIGTQVAERTRREHVREFAPSTEGHAVALPVTADGARTDAAAGAAPLPEAWLVAIKDAGPPSEFDRLTLRQAVTIVALELLRRRVAGDTERRLAGDLLAAVLAGELCGAELERRLQPFGLGERVATLVVGCEGRERSEEALWTAVRAQGSDGLVARSGALACALVPDPGSEPELFEFAERVAERLEAHLGTPARLGVGRALAAGEARRSFHEARCALEAGAIATGNGQASTGNGQARTGNGKHVGEHSRIATYRDLGAFQLLLALQGDEALRLYCDSLLCPLESGEGHYGGELVRSLEVFIEENGQWERAARRLYCHRHTLRYRIRRIEELTGRDLSGARDRIEFWLAIRGRELVS